MMSAQAMLLWVAPVYARFLFAPRPMLLPWLDAAFVSLGVLSAVTAFLTYSGNHVRAAQVAQALVIILVVWLFIALRVLSFRNDLIWPSDFLFAVVMSYAMFGGYRWVRMTIGIAVCFLVTAGLEAMFHGGPPATLRIVIAFIFSVIAGLGVLGFEAISRVSWINHRYAKVLSRTDPLTGLSTRADFNRMLLSRFAQARRDARCIAVLLLDIDHFKVVNDTYGHLFGDEVLRVVGRLVLAGFSHRPLDMQVRFGGEEIALLWYDIDEPQISSLSDRLLESIRGQSIVEPITNTTVSITASIGITWLVPAGDISPETVLRRADGLMYRAKQQGRNRILVEPFYPAPAQA